MKLAPLVLENYRLNDASSIVDLLFNKLNESNKHHTEQDFRNGRACAYSIGESTIQLEYIDGQGKDAMLTVGISSPRRREFRAVRTYLMEQLKEIAPGYNIMNMEKVEKYSSRKKDKKEN